MIICQLSSHRKKVLDFPNKYINGSEKTQQRKIRESVEKQINIHFFK